MSLSKVHVDLGARSYDIHIGPSLLAQSGDLISPLVKRKKVAIVTETNVAALHLETVEKSLNEAGFEFSTLSLAPGEATKDWNNLSRTVEWLLAQKIERDDIVIALGGGVIGDLVGFSAAVLRRGVDFVQIPTSLLAQVDSSVGGKTGINASAGKNLVGAFHQPILVISDVDVLKTLTTRDFLSGFAEVVKYGLLGDATFFEWLEVNATAIEQRDQQAIAYAVERSCQMKAEIVARDEKERGDRALLNLGHTFGHALEAATGYSDRLLHGEGVSIGCGLAFDMSMRAGLCSQEVPSRVRAYFARMGMKSDVRDIEGDLPDAQGLLALMAQDKKVQNGQVTYIAAHDIGDAVVKRDIDPALVESVLADALAAR